ncbi:NYN domain-containing protein [uncultured Blautia sp.]|uniref:NYN domain-containing protein n=1 Tax=Blautia sp. HCP28S3_G10 TaxID=3438908 RepID=UPI0025D91EA4|nr:NYN domain-containing protein [uncultured Blautia sp.]
MKNLKKIAMLIDADNTQLSKLEAVIQEISANGRIVVKRAYGNWRKDSLKNWENELKRLAIKPQQQFDYVSGKNATDMALVIDTLDLLHSGIYDAFVIVASDSDYTPLAIKLHESGVYVMGVGEKKTPEAFRNACDEFVYLENLNKENDPPASRSGCRSANGNRKDLDNAEVNDDRHRNDDMREIHKLLRIAWDKYQDDDRYVNVSSAGQYIKRAKPDFDARTYGYVKLPDLIEAFPKKYAMKRYPGKGTVTIIAYKCI